VDTTEIDGNIFYTTFVDSITILNPAAPKELINIDRQDLYLKAAESFSYSSKIDYDMQAIILLITFSCLFLYCWIKGDFKKKDTED
jgi:hypothetical protein